MRLSRRHLMQGALGAAAASSLLPGTARAAEGKTTVVIVNLPGGLHSLHAQADSFIPKGLFSCTGTNTRAVGNGVVVDSATFGTLAPDVLSRMCNVGVWHGITAHELAATRLVVDPHGRSYPVQLAHAMGGAAVACADVGRHLSGRHEAIGTTGVSKLADTGAVLAALGVPSIGPEVPERAPALAGLRASIRMSTPTLARNQRSLESVTNGLTAAVRALAMPPALIDWPGIATAYGVDPNNTLIAGFATQFAAAELLVHAGTNVVLISSGGGDCSLGWDTHADHDGSCARGQMSDLLLPSLRTFLSRTINLPGHNVITALIGDFTRAAASEHAGMLVASVWGPHIIQGTSGAFEIVGPYQSYAPRNGQSPGITQLWSFLAAAAGAAENPFGVNPHPFI